MTVSGLDAELVAPAAKVLYESMTTDDYTRRSISLQPPHRPQPCFEPTVVALDPVVRVLISVVERAG